MGIAFKLFLWIIIFYVTSAFAFWAIQARFIQGNSSTTFYSFLIPIIVVSIDISFLYVVVFFLYLRRFLKQLLLKKLIIGIFFVGSLIFSFIRLADSYGILPLLFKPLPIIPNATDASYAYKSTGLGSPSTEFTFRWKDNLSLEERIVSSRQAIKLYDVFAKENGFAFSDGFADDVGKTDHTLYNGFARPLSFRELFPPDEGISLSCEDVFIKGLEKFPWKDKVDYVPDRNLRIICSFWRPKSYNRILLGVDLQRVSIDLR